MQVELGDMIIWHDDDGDTDLGWVVHIENRALDNGLNNLIYVKWLFEDATDQIWEISILEHAYMTLTKGGQHDR